MEETLDFQEEYPKEVAEEAEEAEEETQEHLSQQWVDKTLETS